MNVRKMDSYGSAKAIVAEIVSECALNGKSAGWAAYNYDLFVEVRDMCARFNVMYTCDFNGEFTHKS